MGHSGPRPSDPVIRSGVGWGRRCTGWVTLGTGEELELAEPVARLRAKFIDGMILVAVIVMGVFVVLLSAAAGEWGAGIGIVEGVLISSVILALVSVLYDPAMIAIRGQTIGKMVTGIRVVRLDDGELPSWGRSFGRWVLPGVLLAIPGIGFVPVVICWASLTWDPSRRGWHDKVAGTVVVKT